MKTLIKILTITTILLITFNKIGQSEFLFLEHYNFVKSYLLYDNIVATIYYPTKNQCDDTPDITADGSRIDIDNASTLRWVAISQDMLYDTSKLKYINNKNDNRFKGKIKFGDTIMVVSKHEKINGIWIVHDVLNKRYTQRIDFLQSIDDKSIYGKYDSIKIYKLYNKN